MACWQTCASCKEAYIASAVCTEAIEQDNAYDCILEGNVTLCSRTDESSAGSSGCGSTLRFEDHLSPGVVGLLDEVAEMPSGDLTNTRSAGGDAGDGAAAWTTLPPACNSDAS